MVFTYSRNLFVSLHHFIRNLLCLLVEVVVHNQIFMTDFLVFLPISVNGKFDNTRFKSVKHCHSNIYTTVLVHRKQLFNYI